MKMRNVSLFCTGLVLLMMLGALTAQADPIYDTSALAELEGTRTVGSGLVFGGGGSKQGASLSWDIDFMGSYYHYSYDFYYQSQQDISHFILDLSDNCTKDSGCIVASSFESNGSVNWEDEKDVEFGIFTTNGNPNFSGSIKGVKFNTSGLSGNSTFHFEFDSPRVPVYGDFYAKGGNGTSNGFAIYNSGATDHLSSIALNFIARPDTETPGGGDTTVPEPASLILLGSGLGIIGLLAARRRR